jgi:hypothetical protein
VPFQHLRPLTRPRKGTHPSSLAPGRRREQHRPPSRLFGALSSRREESQLHQPAHIYSPKLQHIHSPPFRCSHQPPLPLVARPLPSSRGTQPCFAAHGARQGAPRRRTKTPRSPRPSASTTTTRGQRIVCCLFDPLPAPAATPSLVHAGELHARSGLTPRRRPALNTSALLLLRLCCRRPRLGFHKGGP